MGLDASGAEMEKAAIDFMNKNLGADADAAKMAEFAAKMIDGKTKEGVAFRNYLLGKSRVNDAIQAVIDEYDGAISEKDIERALSRDASRLDFGDKIILEKLAEKLNEIVHPKGEVSVEQERINGSNDARAAGAGTDNPNEAMLAELDAKRKVTAADDGGILLVDGEGHTRMTDGKDMTYAGMAGLEEARDGRRKELMDKSGMGEENEGGGNGGTGGADESKGGDNPPKPKSSALRAKKPSSKPKRKPRKKPGPHGGRPR